MTTTAAAKKNEIFVNEHLENNALHLESKNICLVWEAVKPVLQHIAKFFLVPKKWKAAINKLTASFDLVCSNPDTTPLVATTETVEPPKDLHNLQASISLQS